MQSSELCHETNPPRRKLHHATSSGKLRYDEGMLKRDYPTQYCSMASTLEIIGERWTILIVRDIFLGVRRFDDLQRDLGVARNILQVRLERLVEEGIVVKRP